MDAHPIVDFAAGLALSGNDPALYRRVLTIFHATHGGDERLLQRAMAESDPAAAQAIAHALKGIVGMLGAGALQTTAERAMHACADDANTARDDWKTAVADLIRDLAPVMAAVRQVIDDSTGDAAMASAARKSTAGAFVEPS